MDKPKTPLYYSKYPEDWKAWVDWYVQHNEFDNVAEAIKAAMTETKGRINPSWVIDALEKKNA